ncbi:hypothetical protein [Kaarinaea lacus]
MKYWIFIIIVLSIGLIACQADHRPPAPLGEREALEKLASAYETLSEQLPVSPTGLTPQGKLKFVQEVYRLAGYDFTATLQALAQTSPENLTSYHKDMMELVLLPNQGLSQQAAEDLFNATQLASIRRITTLYTY